MSGLEDKVMLGAEREDLGKRGDGFAIADHFDGRSFLLESPNMVGGVKCWQPDDLAAIAGESDHPADGLGVESSDGPVEHDSAIAPLPGGSFGQHGPVGGHREMILQDQGPHFPGTGDPSDLEIGRRPSETVGAGVNMKVDQADQWIALEGGGFLGRRRGGQANKADG